MGGHGNRLVGQRRRWLIWSSEFMLSFTTRVTPEVLARRAEEEEEELTTTRGCLRARRSRYWTLTGTALCVYLVTGNVSSSE